MRSTGIYRPVASVGIAWTNGRSPTGRRRFTLAHELGHHVFQDEYAVDWPVTGDEGTERIINAFAVHLLLPRMGLKRRWEELANDDAEPRERAILIAAEFGASWSAALAQLGRIGLLSLQEQKALLQEPPRRGDYVGLDSPMWMRMRSTGAASAILRNQTHVRAAIEAGQRHRRKPPGRQQQRLRRGLTAVFRVVKNLFEWPIRRSSAIARGCRARGSMTR